ncbi:CcdB family protein [Pelagerythrobacter rhizovicinus]|uniref:Toxin CcdB n=1 Tax=Pelagerythrobacter rhizovicinus TaxID=2268576 RepID=A0A4Q2KLG9_9SPHN|nr:CcdB family protein [Pelagerythrobacter rhizovicinus]RXZ66148.1 plasmid maintenance protein CcdB [Pelagerythrobacter rhizovicinus]
MAKFDVYRLRDGSTLVVDCQADLLRDLKTRFVVPLMLAEEAPPRLGRLNPVIEFEGLSRLVVPQAAASIPVTELQSRVGSLAEHDVAIGNALDMLISGF